MRTTVTLDPDLAAKLRALTRERGVSFKDALNGALRRGLSSGPAASAASYQLRSKPMGLRHGVDVDKALGAAARLEDDEIERKLELRK